MVTVLITGGTGMIGTVLTRTLISKDYNVIVLSRSGEEQKITHPKVKYAIWDISKGFIDKDAIADTDYIIHLAGAGVADKRWTDKRKKEIVDSRVKTGNLLVKVVKESANSIRAIISASAIGWYGEDPSIPNPSPFNEDDKAANDFLGTTCMKWENSMLPFEEMDKRLVFLRTGIVLSRDGGALKEFIKPLKFGAATILGNGKQVVSWIHIDDLVNMYINAIENDNLNGVYNAVAPNPVDNKTLVLQLAKSMNKAFYVPVKVPSFMLKIALGEMSTEVLKSATVSSKKMESAGYKFSYPDIKAALDNLFRQKNQE